MCLRTLCRKERTHSVVDFDDADGVFVSFVDAGVLAKLCHPGSASVIGAPCIHDLVHHLQRASNVSIV